jgi:hypothetical protein
MKKPLLNAEQRQIVLKTKGMSHDRYMSYLAKMHFLRDFEKTIVYKKLLQICKFLNEKIL